MPPSALQRAVVGRVLRMASDEYVARPLWEFHPSYRSLVLSERRRRNVLQHDPEPIGDPEYS
jgi:hypothetical protein